mmetsp:Transcript_72725/g.201628  ORF Transcript_72725/g.201628 Transcript_72725/m.201628 type:complete len:229 (-) Transcript_72725:556-1242(-)
MRSLMRARTLTKWSSESVTFSAVTARIGLFNLMLTLCSKACAFFAAFVAAELSSLWLRTSCRKDTGALASSTYTQWPFATCCLRWMPDNFLFAFQFGATPDLKASIASLMAVSSAARVAERWSQSCAFSWHWVVRTSWKLLSALRSLVSWDLSPSLASFSSRFASASAIFSAFSCSANLISFFKESCFLSCMALASNSCWSRVSLMPLKRLSKSSIVAMMSLEWYVDS